MPTLHIVSHTHWDREWYLTFQQFRLKLVHLVDGLLDLLSRDPDFKHFTLDGQTIVLEDYLQIRPEREAELRAHVQNGRILIGPWYILPDEFLVSPEAHIRNLLEGERIARRFGPKMNVGYLPDTFGHIGQMPQILRGFDMETAAIQRGAGDRPCEFWWQAPDGSRVLMAYLRDGYSNAAGLNTANPDQFVREIEGLRAALLPHTAVDHLLLMHGTDHMEPPPGTSTAIAHANAQQTGNLILHSTLPAYFAAIQPQVRDPKSAIPIITGELRSPQRHALLPNVLSTRIWIKQRNHACETLLEKWAEPFSLWAKYLEGERANGQSRENSPLISQPASFLRAAWRLLMQCHPHDSICGCSIDPVHAEMRPRFDQVEQIGRELTRQSLEAITQQVDTRPPNDDQRETASHQASIVVFNPSTTARTDWVGFEFEMDIADDDIEIRDDVGRILPHQFEGGESRELFNVVTDRRGAEEAIRSVHGGRVMGMVIRDFRYHVSGDTVSVDVVLATNGEPNLAVWESGKEAVSAVLANPAVTRFVARGRGATTSRFLFVASEVPGHGYRTYWVRGVRRPSQSVRVPLIARLLMPFASRLAPLQIRRRPSKAPATIENEFFRVQTAADGTLTLLDKRRGTIFTGLNRFVDGGDRGDEYNYCPPENDLIVGTPTLLGVETQSGAARQTIVMRLALKVPRQLAPDRGSRAAERVTIPIVTQLSLSPGIPRLDITTEIENTALDHRLRVHFPAPFQVASAHYDGHFEVVQRPLRLPPFDRSWAEQPRPEQPQRLFTAIGDGQLGLLIANRGLPEVEVFTNPAGQTEIAVTLLRSVGWLSRDDLTTRPFNAGPRLPAPEAQLLGKHTFSYAVIPEHTYSGYAQAMAFDTPLQALVSDTHPGFLPHRHTLLATSPAEAFPITAIKACEDDTGWIARGYNLSSDPIEVTLTPWRRFPKAEITNLAEQPLQPLEPAPDGRVTFRANGHQIVTVKFSD